jgi:hypothetical protein
MEEADLPDLTDLALPGELPTGETAKPSLEVRARAIQDAAIQNLNQHTNHEESSQLPDEDE